MLFAKRRTKWRTSTICGDCPNKRGKSGPPTNSSVGVTLVAWEMGAWLDNESALLKRSRKELKPLGTLMGWSMLPVLRVGMEAGRGDDKGAAAGMGLAAVTAGLVAVST